MFNSILFTFVHILIASLWIQKYPVHWRQTLLCMLKSTNQRRVVNCDNPLVARFWDARSTETARVADGDSLQHTGRSHANTVFWHPAERGVCDPQHPRPVRQGISCSQDDICMGMYQCLPLNALVLFPLKISEAEFYINGQEFKFYCKPYFLRYGFHCCAHWSLIEWAWGGKDLAHFFPTTKTLGLVGLNH